MDGSQPDTQTLPLVVQQCRPPGRPGSSAPLLADRTDRSSLQLYELRLESAILPLLLLLGQSVEVIGCRHNRIPHKALYVVPMDSLSRGVDVYQMNCLLKGPLL